MTKFCQHLNLNQNLPPARQTGATSKAHFFNDDAMSEVYDIFNSIVLLSPGLLIS